MLRDVQAIFLVLSGCTEAICEEADSLADHPRATSDKGNRNRNRDGQGLTETVAKRPVASIPQIPAQP